MPPPQPFPTPPLLDPARAWSSAIARGDKATVLQCLAENPPRGPQERASVVRLLNDRASGQIAQGRTLDPEFEVAVLIRLHAAEALVSLGVNASRAPQLSARQAYTATVLGSVLCAYEEAGGEAKATWRRILVGILHETFKEGTRARPEERARILHTVLESHSSADVTAVLVDGFINHSTDIIQSVTRRGASQRDPRHQPEGVADFLARLSLTRIVEPLPPLLAKLEHRDFDSIGELSTVCNLLSFVWSDQQWLLLSQDTPVLGATLKHWSQEAYAGLCALGTRAPRYFAMICEQLRTLVETQDCGSEPEEFIERCFGQLFATARDLQDACAERAAGILDLALLMRSRTLPAVWATAIRTQVLNPQNSVTRELRDAALHSPNMALMEAGIHCSAARRDLEATTALLCGNAPFGAKQRCALALLHPPKETKDIEAVDAGRVVAACERLCAAISASRNASESLPLLGGLLALVTHEPAFCLNAEASIIAALETTGPRRGSPSHARQCSSLSWRIIHCLHRQQESERTAKAQASANP